MGSTDGVGGHGDVGLWAADRERGQWAADRERARVGGGRPTGREGSGWPTGRGRAVVGRERVGGRSADGRHGQRGWVGLTRQVGRRGWWAAVIGRWAAT